MKITLISPICSDIGICTISPLLKNEGHKVNLLFVPKLLEHYLRPLSVKNINKIAEFINDADLIGLNSFSENCRETTSLIDDIKQTTKAPIILGGIHATLDPKDCIEHADIICVGEGEEAMLELTRKLSAGEETKNIKNLLFRSNRSSNAAVELRAPANLASLPFLDYDLSSQYILQNNRIRNMQESDFNGIFYSYSSRGCPFQCSYCCNAVIHNMHRGKKNCRQRGIDNTIKELKEIKKCFPSCRRIWFNEADFISGKTQEEIEFFSERYKAEVGIPFAIWSNPIVVSDENIRALKQAGLEMINIGTVTGSDRIQRQIYKRNAPTNLYLTKAEILEKYNIDIEYDVILCNPYENDEDIIATIKLLMKLPKPFKILIYNLSFFPKTELYNMALKDGLIDKKSSTHSYRKATYQVWKFKGKNVYLNVVLSLMRGQAKKSRLLKFTRYGMLPEPIIAFLVKKPVVAFFNHLPLKMVIFHGMANFIIAGYIIGQKMLYLQKQLLLIFRHNVKKHRNYN